MPGIMFQDVVCPNARSHRKWYTVPLSFLVHTFVLAVLVVIPLLATDGLPRPRVLMEFVTPNVAAVPVAPPPVRRQAPSPAAALNPTGAPVVAPDRIGIESGIVFQPGDVEASGIEGIGGLDVGVIAADVAPPPPPPAGPVEVGGVIRAPGRTRYVAPEYPQIARSAGIQGVVIIEAVIGVDGKVEQARVVRSKPFLDEAALAAVRSWEYTPTLLNGRPTAVIMTVTVQFTLKH